MSEPITPKAVRAALEALPGGVWLAEGQLIYTLQDASDPAFWDEGLSMQENIWQAQITSNNRNASWEQLMAIKAVMLMAPDLATAYLAQADRIEELEELYFAAKHEEEKAWACAEELEAEREATLDAASEYLGYQYGMSVLSHPVDRARIAAIRDQMAARSQVNCGRRSGTGMESASMPSDKS